MLTQFVQLLNINVCFFGVTVIDMNLDRERKENHLEIIMTMRNYFVYVQAPLEIISAVIWAVIYWQGTKFEQLFSVKKKILVGGLGFLNVVLSFIHMIHGYRFLDDDAMEISIIILCIFLCDLQIYSRYFLMSFKPKFFGSFLKDFDEN